MAYEDNTGLLPDAQDSSAFMNSALLADAEKLARRKAELRAKAEAAAKQLGIYSPAEITPDQNFTSAVTGTPILGANAKPSKLAQYAPIVQTVMNEVAQKRLDEDVSGHTRLVAEAAQRHLSAKPADDAPDNVKLQWAQAGASIPSLKPTMEAYVADELTKAPERREAREFRRTEANLARQERQERAEADRASREALAKNSNELRATIAQLMAGRPQIVIGSDGTVQRVSPQMNGPVQTVPGATGKPSAAVEKTKLEGDAKVKNAKEGLALLSEMEPLLNTATSSGIGALRDQAYGMFGKSTDAGDAAGQLAQMGAKLTSMADRMPGQVSDADLKFLAATTGGLGDPTVPASRKAAVIKRVREQFERAAEGGESPEPMKARPGAYKEPTITESVRSAYVQQLTKEWQEAPESKRPLIEQRMLSLGVPVPSGAGKSKGGFRVLSVE